VAAYIGGLHLIDNAEAGDDIKGIADVIRSKYPDMKLYAGHCTGSRAIEILSSELGNQLETLYSGKEIEISSATGQIF
jgi:7,8-dihydropterin-6-yl-methyl-4-(beta-D-ribofuranosyl)aminobenzene 5'-phosphate synthase